MNKLEIMKLQTFKMFEGEDTVYVRRDDILELLEQEPCEDEQEEYEKAYDDYLDLVNAEQEPYICDTCKHKDDSWDTEPCDGCCGAHSGYEPTITSIGGGVIYYPQVEGITPTVVAAEQEPWCDTCKYSTAAFNPCNACKDKSEYEPCDAISRGVFEQVMWERDVAIEQLKELGYGLGEKPKTGHWIEHPEIETSTPEYLMFYECSECGDKQCFCKSNIHKKHFCNNCGAKMESEDKE